MPIRPENKARYPANWKEISLDIRGNRAKWRCECDGRCGRKHWDGRCLRPDKRIIKRDYETGCTLTVAHLDHQPENCDPENLMAMCEACHNKYDAKERAAGRKRRRQATNFQPELELS